MNKYEHCMVDIETLGKKSSAVVLSIGAAVFNLSDRDTAKSLCTPVLVSAGEPNRCFYMPLSIQPQLDKGRIVDASTIQWWMKQSDAARRVFQQKTERVDVVLGEFRQFCVRHGIEYLWGNGNTFDNMILRSLYEDFYPGKFPVCFRSDMDLRTYRLAAGSPDYETMGIERVGTAHNALDDARYQVLQAQHYHQLINRAR